jgi:cyclophilin family peptidyl-prolyl cis-trans isomerase/HEAT repeat protein
MPNAETSSLVSVTCAVVFGIWHSASGIDTPASRDRIHRVLIAEDARAPQSTHLQVILDAAADDRAEVRRVAVRALGRLERPALIDRIAPLLGDPEPSVRSEAANALGQSLFGRSNPDDREARRRVLDTLVGRLAAETDVPVRGTILRTIGRLGYEEADDIRRAESVLAASLLASASELEGAVRGLESLFRLRDKIPPTPVTIERLRRVALETWPTVGGAFETERFATIRRLAVQALRSAAGLDTATARAAFRDPDWQVRRLVASNQPSQAMRDPLPQVRFEGIRVSLENDTPSPTCAALRGAARDPDPHVARAAVTRLGRPCVDGDPMTDATALLAAVARRAPVVPRIRWQIASAAAGALAQVCGVHRAAARDCGDALHIVRSHANDATWQVRMYAASAAAALKDLSIVRRLAADPHPNVREAAVRALAESGDPADRSLIVDALASDDYQLVRSAARALYGVRDPPVVDAMSAAFRRLRNKQSDTSRDTLAAIRDSLRGAGIELLEADPDPTLHAPPFTRDELDELFNRDRRAVVTMEAEGTFELSLLTDEAPASVARFVTLAQRGAYNGLTFHRVEPNFVIQGGSPGANEYAGHDPYMRDEVGLTSHARGTIGISTRGRDTGDAQIFINLVDNPRLDHRYTVFARVTRGMDVVDRIVEGDVIARIVIR